MSSNLSFAYSLLPPPQILLMGEPFVALDAQIREVMHNPILHVSKLEKTTVVFVTHDVEEAIYLGQRVVVMAPRPGRVESIYPVELPEKRDRDMKLAPEFLHQKETIPNRIRKFAGMRTDYEMLERLTRQAEQQIEMQ